MSKTSFDFEPPEVAYVDPSFFLNLLVKDSKHYEECKNFSEKLKERKTILIMSNLGLDEIWYVLLKLLAIKDFGLRKWQAKLKKDVDLVRKYSRKIEEYTTNLLEIPNLFFVEITTDQTLHALDLMKKYGLFPRDAIHASVVVAGIDNLITLDPDFLRIKEIKVWKP